MISLIYLSIVTGIICGIMGVLIVQKNLIMMTGGIAHTSFGGLGLGILCGFPPIIGAAGFAAIAALVIESVKEKYHEKSDVVISLFWALGMSLGVLFVNLSGKDVAIDSYLFGNIFDVNISKIVWITIAAVIILSILTVFYETWVMYLFDEENAKISGINIHFFSMTLMLLVALSVVALFHVAGIILVVALVSAPAVTARIYTNNLKTLFFLSILLSIVYCLVGVSIAYYFQLNAGGIVASLSIIVYFISLVTKKRVK